MKNIWIAFGSAAFAAILFEYFGFWWAMPVAGGIAGWMMAQGKQGFLSGGLGVAVAWGIYMIYFAATSPLGKMLAIFSGILGLGASLSFAPVLLALLIAFFIGGLGGLTGAYAAQARTA